MRDERRFIGEMRDENILAEAGFAHFNRQNAE